MKKINNIFMGLVLLITLIGCASQYEAHAEIKLESNAEKECDLDGDGENEIISFSYSSSEYLDWVRVFINGKQLYYFFNKYNADFYDVSVSVYDINPSDNQKEVMIELLSEVTHSYYAYRYKNNKLKLLFKVEAELNDFIILSKQKKGNKILVRDAAVCALGNHVPIIKKCKIKNKKLVEIVPKSKTYNVTDDKWGKRWYTAAKEIKVYKKVSDQKSILTIRPGEKFSVEKIIYVDSEATYGLINTIDKEEVGWINIKMYEGCTWDDPLIVDPGFAG